MSTALALQTRIAIDGPAEHLEVLHGLNRNSGFIALGHKAPSDGVWRQYLYPYEELHEGLSLAAQGQLNTLKPWAQQLTDVYVSQNTFFIPSRRTSALRQLRALYVDLDVYNARIEGSTKIGRDQANVLMELEAEYFGRLLPRPTMVVDSGRGLYLIWLIEPESSLALPRWNIAEARLFSVLAVKEGEEGLGRFGADPACKDPARVLRLVGSINSKNGSRVRIVRDYGHIYNLNFLMEEYIPGWLPLDQYKAKAAERKAAREAAEAARMARKAARAAKPRPKRGKVSPLRTERTLLIARAEDLALLCELRGYNTNPGGPLYKKREIILFYFRHWLTQARHADPLKATLELNAQFTQPRDPDRVKRDTANVVGKDGKWHITNKRLIELFSITEDEQMQMQTIISPEVMQKRYNLRRHVPKDQNKRIGAKERHSIQVHALMGMRLTNAQIAAATHLSIRQIQRIKRDLKADAEAAKAKAVPAVDLPTEKD